MGKLTDKKGFNKLNKLFGKVSKGAENKGYLQKPKLYVVTFLVSLCVFSVCHCITTYDRVHNNQLVDLPPDFRDDNEVLASDIENNVTPSEKDNNLIFYPWETVTPAKHEISASEFTQSEQSKQGGHVKFRAITKHNRKIDDFDIQHIKDNDKTPSDIKALLGENVYSTDNEIVQLEVMITFPNIYAKQLFRMCMGIYIESDNCAYILSDSERLFNISYIIHQALYDNFSGLNPESTEGNIDNLIVLLNKEDPNYKITNLALFDVHPTSLGLVEPNSIYSVGDTYWRYDMDSQQLVEITEEEYNKRSREIHENLTNNEENIDVHTHISEPDIENTDLSDEYKVIG